MLDKVSTTYDEHKRNLLTADECMRLPAATKDASDKIVAPGDMIVLVAGEPPICGKAADVLPRSEVARTRTDPAPRVPDKIVHSDKEAQDGDEIDQALAAC